MNLKKKNKKNIMDNVFLKIRFKNSSKKNKFGKKNWNLFFKKKKKKKEKKIGKIIFLNS